MIVEGNRVFIELALRRPNGTLRKARAWVGTSGGSFIITERLLDELKLARTGEPINADWQQSVPIAKPAVFLADMPLDLNTARAFAVIGATRVHAGVDAEVFLPARVLMHYEAVFDYPARRFTLAQPGILKPHGERVASPIQRETGFPRIELMLDGKTYGFLLDTDAAYTMISRELLEQVATRHPDWPRLTGAVGEANMIGGKMEIEALLLRLPELHWGALQISDVGAVSRPKGTFETWMSRMTTADIVGAIAGNVLKSFRLHIDYPHDVTYLEMTGHEDAHDLDAVGLTVRIAAHGDVSVAGIAANRDGTPVVRGIEMGDKLLQVGGVKMAGATLARVIAALHGKPGNSKRLLVERNGKQLMVITRVDRLL